MEAIFVISDPRLIFKKVGFRPDTQPLHTLPSFYTFIDHGERQFFRTWEILNTYPYVLFNIQGNLKAAITADVIQGITMIIISFGVIAQGIYESGGIEKVYAINKEHGMYKIKLYVCNIYPICIQ